MSDKLVLERKDGWPNGLAHIFLGGGLVLLLCAAFLPVSQARSIVRCAAGTCLPSCLSLYLYRRGTLIDRQSRTLYRWWGLGFPGLRTVRLRYTEGRSIQGYRTVSVHSTSRHDTWKTWRQGMYHVQLERPDGKLGPSCPFRVRLIVDDEFTSLPPAVKTAHDVGQFLNLAVVVAEGELIRQA